MYAPTESSPLAVPACAAAPRAAPRPAAPVGPLRTPRFQAQGSGARGARAHVQWVAAGLFVLAALPPTGAGAQVLLTQEEALRLAFPEPAEIERRTAFLGDAELEAARELAGKGVDMDHSVVTYYVGKREGQPLGAAYFDVQRVRTLPAVLMVVVTPDERIERIEILKWSEPPEYRAPQSWFAQFPGQALTDALSLRGAIRNMTGASLTSQAVTRVARRVLALDHVIHPFAARGAAQEAGR